MNLPPQNETPWPATSRPNSKLPAAQPILALLTIRWAAGVLENIGLNYASQAAAIAMLIYLVLQFLYHPVVSKMSARFVAGIALWILAGVFSLVANPAIDVQSSAFLLALLALYALFANALFGCRPTNSDLTLLTTFFAMFVVVGLWLSVFQILTQTGFVEHGTSRLQRAFGSDVHPVSFGIQIVAALVALEVLRNKLGRRAGLVHIALIVAGIGALYLTYARTAWVMGSVVLIAGFVLRGSIARRLILGILGLTIAVPILMTSQRFGDLASLPAFLENFSFQEIIFDWRYVDNSISWRIVNWGFGLQQAMEAPIFGFGPGQSAQSSYFGLEMHNIFLEALFEGGVFGAIALLVTLAGLTRIHRDIPRATAADRHCRLITNSFGVALAMAVFFSTSFVDQLMSLLLYLLLLWAANAPAANKNLTTR